MNTTRLTIYSIRILSELPNTHHERISYRYDAYSLKFYVRV